MTQYTVIVLEDAISDIDKYIHHIRSVYKSPHTAKKHYDELYAVIRQLSNNADMYQLQTRESIIQKFGVFARRVNYKKMAVIFTIFNNTVYVQSVVAQSMITD